jgi:hypothetical protein
MELASLFEVGCPLSHYELHLFPAKSVEVMLIGRQSTGFLEHIKH